MSEVVGHNDRVPTQCQPSTVNSNNASWLERQQTAIAACGQRPPPKPTAQANSKSLPVFARGSGVRLRDTQGVEYLDLTCGYSATNFGHAYPPLVQALQAAANRLGHLTGDAHTGKIQLAEQLIQLCSPPPQSVPYKALFNSSGSRAIETAWKAAISFRPGRIVTLAPAFHGRSLAISPLSHTPRTNLSLPADAFETRAAGEYPYCGRCPMQSQVTPYFPDCELACSQSLFTHLDSPADEISAVVVEPAIGARGYLFPPAEFLQRLREITRQRGLLLIADEVQTGIGRCGDWLLSHRQGWQADLIVLGKSLGGGLLPISAVVGRGDIMDAIPVGAESETFSATPIACDVALAVLELLSDGQLYRRADSIGQTLREWFKQHPLRQAVGIRRVEGEGASCVLEFATEPLGRTLPDDPPQQAAKRLAASMFDHGLLIHHTGPELTRIVLLPPLTITDDDLQHILGTAAAAVEQAANRSLGFQPGDLTGEMKSESR